MKKKRKSIKSKLIMAFAVILLLPSLVIGGTSYETAKRKVEEKIIYSAKENVSVLDKFITRTIEPAIKDIEFMAATLEGPGAQVNQAEVLQKLTAFQQLHPEILHTFTALKTGQMLLIPKGDLPKGYDPRTRIWYEKAVAQKGGIAITEPYVDAESGSVVVTISALLKGGSGVVGVDLNLRALSDNVNHIKIGREGYAFIVDQTKKLVSHPLQKAGEEAQASLTAKMFASAEGEFIDTSDGVEKRLFFATNELTGWKIAGAMNVSEAKDEASPIFWMTVGVLAVALLYGAVRSFFVIRSIIVPLKRINEAAHRISEGDLTERINMNSTDELGELSESFDHMADSLAVLIREVNHKSEQLAASSQELAASAEQTNEATEQITSVMQEVAGGSERQVSGMEQSVRTIAGMSAGAQEMATHAQFVNHAALQTKDMAEEGNEALQQAVAQMRAIDKTVHELSDIIKGLGSRSNEIGQIIEVITAISTQTNLLALNAAIEAARAGEHGKGFAVVADEVRKLAEQSAQSAGQIAMLIHAIQQETQAAVQSMHQGTKEVAAGIAVVGAAGELFTRIQGSIAEAAAEFETVSSAVEQVSGGTQEIAATMDMIARITDTNSADIQTVFAATEEQMAFMQEISSSSAMLSRMADELHDIIRRFSI
ncbi:methyl-accepting chemotaxis protein [Aneurinibacillus sp. REN35]|uniref:methyl-accepting chemotaxis protein n=1 Tax=Aneurinibacillus sp. REN35 TaxID=3237286 RepID=UPI0035298058